MELARLAPLVVSAAAEAEPVAAALIAEAAAHLADSVRPDPPGRRRGPGGRSAAACSPADTPLAAAVRAELARRWPDAPLRTAGDGAAAAAWLAARDLPEVTDPAALHARLFPPLTAPPLPPRACPSPARRRPAPPQPRARPGAQIRALR